jgi:DNA-binding NtrC family response regulator
MRSPEPRKKTERILVLDLDDWCQQFLSSVIKMLGCEYTLVTSVEEALKVLSEEVFDLLITDLKVPETPRLLDDCRQRFPSLHFILMTPRRVPTHYLVQYEQTEIVSKPLSLDEIVRKIQQAILQKHRRQLEEDLRRLRQAAFRMLE